MPTRANRDTNSYEMKVVNGARAPHTEIEDRFCLNIIEYGASPRATISLAIAARAHAFMRHRGYVTPEDIHAIGKDVLRHRVIISYEAEAREISSEQIVQKIFETVEIP